MKISIAAVALTLFVVLGGYMYSVWRGAQEGTTEVAAETTTPAPAPVVTFTPTNEQRESWEAAAVERLTAEHQLHLNAEQQRLYRSNLIKQLRSQAAFAQTGAPEFKEEARRSQATVDHLDGIVLQAQSAP